MVLADVRLYQEGLARLLAADSRVLLVGAGPVDGAALGHVLASRPDVVLLEAAVACRTTTVRVLAQQAPGIKVVAYGVQDEEQQALRCAEAGVAAFVMGDATAQELVATIVGCACGDFHCSPRIAAMLVRRVSALAQGVVEDRRDDDLTPRERTVVGLIDDGLSNKEIARRLGIELSTVKNHVHHVLEKLHASRRAQAAAHFRLAQIRRHLPEPIGSSP
jgi:two-component system, NarL family, nitrate/nitrite response regulator NarL